MTNKPIVSRPSVLLGEDVPVDFNFMSEAFQRRLGATVKWAPTLKKLVKAIRRFDGDCAVLDIFYGDGKHQISDAVWAPLEKREIPIVVVTHARRDVGSLRNTRDIAPMFVVEKPDGDLATDKGLTDVERQNRVNFVEELCTTVQAACTLRRLTKDLQRRAVEAELARDAAEKKLGKIKRRAAHRAPWEDDAFIVHGHDEEAKLELKNYLQNTLHFKEPIILHEQPNHGQTIIQKFETYAALTSVAFILLTPDDKMAQDLRPEEMFRARQNVIFEMGYFLGLLGRESGRVILLHKGHLEIPSDIAGVTYIDIEYGVEAAGEEIRREVAALYPHL